MNMSMSTRRTRSVGWTLQAASCLLLIAMAAPAAVAEEAGGRPVLWDDRNIPESEMKPNPFNMLFYMYSTEPVLDSKGEPHQHGHVLQWIQDGGNGMQDAPNPDGSPGGDDSLALGNFNMITMHGLDGTQMKEGKSGKWYSARYFVPTIRDAVYYLRLWEGDDVRTAPYYQNSSEYQASTGDQGGGMIHISPATIQGPQEADWRFGPSTPRPAAKH